MRKRTTKKHRTNSAKKEKKDGTALVVLGGSHDLGPYLGNDVLYIRITSRSYPDEGVVQIGTLVKRPALT